ncbi:hypothetical protein RJP21_04415 [Paenibacillus sp. VCA1]|uniref:DUF6060 domain-containing protein n=1 Tax=Paenibacillus sp. VCA1 TaxID=3039148 RepID=UPI0028722B38|nr:hypothetical protein [Paenibacillus sp. VCA1]MDR9852848.1 hypothetical protein [Paenibacillus sp. VCA1]
MKIFKIGFTGFLSLLIFAVFAFSASANPVSDETSATKNVDGDQYFQDPITGKTITTVYKTTPDGGLEKVDFEEFVKIRQQDQEIKDKIAKSQDELTPLSRYIIPTGVLVTIKYTKQLDSEVTGSAYRVTDPYNCPSNAPNPCTSNATYSATESESFSANVANGDILKQIKLQCSYTWSSSASVSNTYSLSITQGKTGYLMFIPHKIYTQGKQDTYADFSLVKSETVWGYTPKTLTGSGILDGYVYGVIE